MGVFFSQNEEKNPATKSAKKSGGSTIKIREKSVLPKTDPRILQEKIILHWLVSGRNGAGANVQQLMC